MKQYTIRNVPAALDHELRKRASRLGSSLNEAAIEALKRGVGIADSEVSFDDLDDLAGTWKADSVFDQAIVDQDSVDPDLWR